MRYKRQNKNDDTYVSTASHVVQVTSFSTRLHYVLIIPTGCPLLSLFSFISSLLPFSLVLSPFLGMLNTISQQQPTGHKGGNSTPPHLLHFHNGLQHLHGILYLHDTIKNIYTEHQSKFPCHIHLTKYTELLLVMSHIDGPPLQMCIFHNNGL